MTKGCYLAYFLQTKNTGENNGISAQQSGIFAHCGNITIFTGLMQAEIFQTSNPVTNCRVMPNAVKGSLGNALLATFFQLLH
jgi:hypothetical protein